MKVKRILQRLLFEILKFFLILSVIFGAVFCIHRIGTFSEEECAAFVLKNTETGADAFSPFLYGIYFVSENEDKNNELFIFETANSYLSDVFHLKTRYKPVLHTTSEENIPYIIHERSDSYSNPDKFLVFYSNNKDMVSFCTYTYTRDDGSEQQETKNINRFRPFIIQIPFSYNYGDMIFDINKVSFFDENGNLLYEVTDPSTESL